MHTAWRQASATDLARRLRWPAVIALVLGILVPLAYGGTRLAAVFIGTVAGFWVIAAALHDPVLRLFGRGPRITRAASGMQIAHTGLGLCAIGIIVVSTYTVETDQVISPGESVEVAGYEFRMSHLEEFQGPNYSGIRGYFDVTRNGSLVSVLAPEKRVYRVQQSPMTEAAIDSSWSRDLFVALGEPVGDGAWSTRIQYKPLIGFIWFGSFVIFVGGMIALSDRRYRRKSLQTQGAPSIGADGRPEPETT
jgi:cytochrome c-type biogenesis protein CcmF